MSEVSGFFSGGGKAAKFPTPGTTVAGTVTMVHPPEPQTDFETRLPIPGKTQIRIELATDLRDATIDADDGSRTLYIKGWLIGAIGDALRKAGVKEPKVGGTLSVTYTGDGAPARPGLRGPKQYSATYTAPDTGSFFSGANGSAQAVEPSTNAPVPTEAPAGIDAKAWETMPADAKQAIANATAAVPTF